MRAYIKDGKFIRGESVLSGDGSSNLVKQDDHDDQRFMHQWELIQPYGPDGKPNPEFVENYYEESKQYGFIKDTTEE
jgi:hypothetical protein